MRAFSLLSCVLLGGLIKYIFVDPGFPYIGVSFLLFFCQKLIVFWGGPNSMLFHEGLLYSPCK